MSGESLSFDELVDRMREPLAELERMMDELEPAMREFVRDLRSAIDAYDEAGQ